MEHLITGVLMLFVVFAGLIGYYCGKTDKSQELIQARHRVEAEIALKGIALKELDTTRRVQHNLNCLIVDLKDEIDNANADALAFKTVKGLWATDNKHLVEYHIRKECFRRIGYPEERL